MMDHREFESRGQLLRRLDRLHKRLTKEKENYSSKPNWFLNTGDLERLRSEARYCSADVGLVAEDALREISGIDFTKFDVLDPESPTARYGQIESKYRVLDADSERECIRNLDRLIELIETVRKRLEGGSDIMPAPVALSSSVRNTTKDSHAIRDLVTPSLRSTVTATPIRNLDALLKQKSLRQSQAAEALDITSRAIRGLVKNGKLSKSARGRIACDQKFAEQFNQRHSPVKR
jgi:hypothetical protein